MTKDQLAACRPRSIGHLLALPGRTRGVQLHDWSGQVARRFGRAAVDDLRDALGAPLAAVGDAPDRAAWLPAGLPLALHTRLVERQLGGDWSALQAPLRDDALAQVPALARWALRAAGMTTVLERAPALHGWLFDHGRAEVDIDGGVGAATARLSIAGGGLFGAPHWCLEQIFALETLAEVCGLQIEAEVELGDGGESASSASFLLRWRRSG